MINCKKCFAELTGSRVLDLAHVGEAAGRLGIDLNGFDPVDRKAVKLLLKLGRPIGQEALDPPALGPLEEAHRFHGQEPAAPTWAAAPVPRLAHELC